MNLNNLDKNIRIANLQLLVVAMRQKLCFFEFFCFCLKRDFYQKLSWFQQSSLNEKKCNLKEYPEIASLYRWKRIFRTDFNQVLNKVSDIKWFQQSKSEESFAFLRAPSKYPAKKIGTITRPNCALDRRTVLCLYVLRFQRQVFKHN